MSVLSEALNNANKVKHSQYKTHFMGILCLMTIADDKIEEKELGKTHFMGILCLMTIADDKIEEKELGLLHQLAQTLPEFRDLSKSELTDITKKAIEKINNYKTPLMAVLFFKEILDVAAKKKCFVLALEMALASGLADSKELPLLEKLQKELELSDEFIAQAAAAMGAKYP